MRRRRKRSGIGRTLKWGEPIFNQVKKNKPFRLVFLDLAVLKRQITNQSI